MNNNKLLENSSWWKRNWKWFLPLIVLLFVIGVNSIITKSIDNNLVDFARAYSDTSLYEKAIEKVKLNQRVKETLGEIEPIDNFAIAEGNTKYSNNNNSVETTIRIKGNRANGKMDISAEKNGSEWKYKKIIIRIKKPNVVIDILN